MEYRVMQDGTKVSVLGFGCMRFTKKGTGLDQAKATEEIKKAFDGGVNYYDTAYVYPGSEACLGEALETLGIRDQVYIATKLPHYLIKSKEGAIKMFEEELKRLRTDHVDYYLMHMLTDVQTWDRLKSLGIADWLMEEKAKGRIRHIGFSYHGNTQEFKKLIDAFDWEFSQIQYNYVDEFSQAGVEGLKYAASKNIPVVIMEGLRGGRLVGLLPQTAKDLIAKAGKTPAELAFKWLYNQPEVTCVLSGMNSVEMVEQNLVTASAGAPGCLTDEEKALIDQVKDEIQKAVKVGCTGCGYCMPCPKNVDIPGAFSCYNKVYTEGKRQSSHEYIQNTTFRKDTTSASQCVECGKCEQHCPQHLPIRAELKNVVKTLETPKYKIAKFAIQKLHLWG